LVATVVFELFCIAGVLFLIRFLVVLATESRRSRTSHPVPIARLLDIDVRAIPAPHESSTSALVLEFPQKPAA